MTEQVVILVGLEDFEEAIKTEWEAVGDLDRHPVDLSGGTNVLL